MEASSDDQHSIPPPSPTTHAAQAALMRHVRLASDRIAVSQHPAGSSDEAWRSVTWAQLDDWSRRWCTLLKERGVQPGDRVAVQASSSLELIAVVVAHHRAAVVHVPINTRYRDREIDHIVEDSGALFLADDALLKSLHDVDPSSAQTCDVAVDDEATAMLIYTSGTTGRSKGVALSFRAIARGIGALTELWQWTAADVLALALPLFHVHGLCIGVHGTLLHGMTAEIHPKFDPVGVVDACDRGATIFMGVPTMYRRLLNYLEEHSDAKPFPGAALAKARLFTSGSAALPAADHRRFEVLTGHSILERYGMSETLLTLSNPYDGERRPGSVGFAVPGTEVRILDGDGKDVEVGQTGELAVRGPSLMSGYYGQPEVTAAAFRDGWFMTGDAASADDDGYLRIVGRKSVDILKCGGFKISAREIEDVLLEHWSVAEVAVVGLSDPEWGQRIEAVVVAEPGATAEQVETLGETLKTHCQGLLSNFKCPRRIEVWDELPRNALGKLQKHRIIEQLTRGSG